MSTLQTTQEGVLIQAARWNIDGSKLLLAAGHVLFSIGRAQELGSSQSRQALRRLLDLERDAIDHRKVRRRTTHLVVGAKLARYLRENRIKLQAPAEAMAAYLKAEGAKGCASRKSWRRY